MLWVNLFLNQNAVFILYFPLARNIEPIFTALSLAIYSSLVITENENTQFEHRPPNEKGKAGPGSQTSQLSQVLVAL